MVALVLIVLAVLLLMSAVRQTRSRRLERVDRHPIGGRPPARPVTVRPRRRSHRHEPHCLYHYVSRPTMVVQGRRYIGISWQPDERHEYHERKSPFFARTTGVMYVVAWYPDYATAHAAEVAAIRAAWAAGEPIENVSHVPGRSRRRAVAR